MKNKIQLNSLPCRCLFCHILGYWNTLVCCICSLFWVRASEVRFIKICQILNCIMNVISIIKCVTGFTTVRHNGCRLMGHIHSFIQIQKYLCWPRIGKLKQYFGYCSIPLETHYRAQNLSLKVPSRTLFMQKVPIWEHGIFVNESGHASLLTTSLQLRKKCNKTMGISSMVKVYINCCKHWKLITAQNWPLLCVG